MTRPPDLLATVGFLVACTLLLVAGVEHLRHPRAARAALAAQRLWPPRAVPALGAGLAGAELLVGAAGLLSALAPASPAGRASRLAAAGLYTAFAVHAAVLLRRRPFAPCGCDASGRPVSAVVVARAALLAGVCVLALGAGRPPAADPGRAAVVALATVAFVLLLRLLPGSLPRPGRPGA